MVLETVYVAMVYKAVQGDNKIIDTIKQSSTMKRIVSIYGKKHYGNFWIIMVKLSTTKKKINESKWQ